MKRFNPYRTKNYWRDAIFRKTLCQKCIYDVNKGKVCLDQSPDCESCEHISKKYGHCACTCPAGFFEKLFHKCKYFKENKD